MDEIAEQQEDEMQDQSICLYDVAQEIQISDKPSNLKENRECFERKDQLRQLAPITESNL